MPHPSDTPARDPQTHLERLDRFSYLLDNSIRLPVLNYRIGVDALIGLIPGIGDLIGVALSSYVVFEAARYGLHWATLFRMVVNVVLEGIIGAIPIIGDLFDATFKANARNVRLLRRRIEQGDTRGKADFSFLTAVFVILVALVVGIAVLAAMAVAAIFDLFT